MASPIWQLEGVALESDGAAVAGSLADRIIRMYDDTNSPISVYPTLAGGVDVTSAATDWGLGTVTQVVPASTITNNFLLQYVVIENISKDGTYELVFYSGAGDAEVARLRFVRTTGAFYGNYYRRLPSALITANSRIRAALACSDGLAGAGTVTVSIGYREIT